MSRSSEYQGTRLQQQIEVELLNYIRTHQLNKGDRLPPQKELAEQLEVSPAALREALARLTNQGVIRQVHGIGTFLAEDPHTIHSSAEINLSLSEMIRAEGMRPGTVWVEVSFEEVPAELADFILPGPDGKVLVLKRVRTADDIPFAYCVAYFAPELNTVLDTAPEAYRGSLYEYLQTHCNEVVTESEAVIEARVAGEEIKQHLKVPEGTPVLTLIQRHRNSAGRTLFASLEIILQKRLKLKVKRFRPGQSK
jgi:GntR family transcriptional regulator